ncbi:unnamed protein product [Calypogeia fissa]
MKSSTVGTLPQAAIPVSVIAILTINVDANGRDSEKESLTDVCLIYHGGQSCRKSSSYCNVDRRTSRPQKKTNALHRGTLVLSYVSQFRRQAFSVSNRSENRGMGMLHML